MSLGIYTYSVSGKSKPKNGPKNTMKVEAKLIVDWNTMNFLMDLKIVLPYKTAFVIEAKLSSRAVLIDICRSDKERTYRG